MLAIGLATAAISAPSIHLAVGLPSRIKMMCASEVNEDDGVGLSATAAFSAIFADSPLLRRYDAARAAAYDYEYRKWYAAIAADDERNARLSAEQREAHDRAVADAIAAEKERTRARVAALELAVSSARAAARKVVVLMAAQVELQAEERERRARRAAAAAAGQPHRDSGRR